MALPIDPARLERIESKIDTLGEAFIIMARVEEKVINMEQARTEANRRYDERITQLLSDMKDVQLRQINQDIVIANNSRVTGYIQWIVGAILTATFSALALQYFGT
jgi:hypothetical protein